VTVYVDGESYRIETALATPGEEAETVVKTDEVTGGM